ncbi:MAG: hypothetical protein Q8880_11990, partial [Bacteroidota bacterium]|nr:hypothetical protein [Bacteroidota bacterium]
LTRKGRLAVIRINAAQTVSLLLIKQPYGFRLFIIFESRIGEQPTGVKLKDYICEFRCLSGEVVKMHRKYLAIILIF